MEEIQQELPVIEGDLFQRTGRHVLYRSGRIYIEKRLPLREKKEVLVEEYGHFKTSAGNIIDQRIAQNQKQELKARNTSYEKLVTLDDLIACSEAGFNNYFECSEYLDVSSDTLKSVFSFYQQKYGTTYFYKGRIFEFGDSAVMILNTGL